MEEDRLNNTHLIQGVSRVMVTMVHVVEGEGVTGNPSRLVTYLYGEDDEEICRLDSWEASPLTKEEEK